MAHDLSTANMLDDEAQALIKQFRQILGPEINRRWDDQVMKVVLLQRNRNVHMMLIFLLGVLFSFRRFIGFFWRVNVMW
jgi:hypothetical protein